MWKWLEHFLYGSPTALVAVPPVQEIAALKQAEEARGRSSLIFDSHIMTEAASSKNPQAVSLAWDEGRAYGFNVAPQSWMGMTPRERKETLLSIFLANPWASNCIDTIALYITSGGHTIEPRPGIENPDESQRDEIEQFLNRVNDDWDFDQLIYEILTDKDVFGESFCEYTMKDGKPYQLFPIDCLTMDTEHDRYGRATKYKQQLTSTSVINELDPRTIIRWWNPHKRAKVDAFSYLEGIQDAILLDKKMTNWQTTFFQKGGKFNYYFKGLGDRDEADRFLTWARANLFGEKNAQTPPVLWGNAEIQPLGNAGPLDMSFDKGLDRMQTIVLSAFHVPPSIACIAESGNRLTDMSDNQRKVLQYIACDPRRRQVFEKFNYRLIAPFWSDWYVSSRYADFRDDESLAKVADIRIRNGSETIDEVRQEMGRDAYEKGGGTPLFAVSKEVVPVERLDEMADEQRQTAQVTLDQAKANADLAQTKAKQAKEPPPPMPTPLQKGQQGVTQNVTTPPGQPGKDKQEADHYNRWQEFHEAMGWSYVDEMQIRPEQREEYFQQRLYLYHAWLYDKEHETYEEQAPHTQSDETHDVGSGQDQSQSDGSLHPTQEATRGDGLSIDRGSGSSTTGEPITTRITSVQETETSVDQSVAEVDKTPHWQDTDEDTQKALVALKAKGVAYLTWESDGSPNICDACVANHGKRVKVGERFPSGAYCTPEHDHCGCGCKEEMEDGSIVSGGEKL